MKWIYPLLCFLSLSNAIFAEKTDKLEENSFYKNNLENALRRTDEIDAFLGSLTPDEHSLLESKIQSSSQLFENPFGIAFYEPSYILPYYRTGKPYSLVYRNITPGSQAVMPEEFKAKMSFELPVWRPFLKKRFSFHISYTQLAYWQVFASSPYFRETNYEPQFFLRNRLSRHWVLEAGLNHQSNGRGGLYERSWNRAFLGLQFSGSKWLVNIKPWMLIFKKSSSDQNNPDIAHYLGHEQISASYHYHDHILTFTLTNIESGFQRGSQQIEWSMPVFNKFNLLLQAFHGYGQSLLEYNHKTTAFGIGFSMSQW